MSHTPMKVTPILVSLYEIQHSNLEPDYCRWKDQWIFSGTKATLRPIPGITKTITIQIPDMLLMTPAVIRDTIPLGHIDIVHPFQHQHTTFLSFNPTSTLAKKTGSRIFSHFSNCADLGRWTDTEKALTLASCLKGPARTFYLGLREQKRRSYFILVQRLNERFGSSRQQTWYLI